MNMLASTKDAIGKLPELHAAPECRLHEIQSADAPHRLSRALWQ